MIKATVRKPAGAPQAIDVAATVTTETPMPVSESLEDLASGGEAGPGPATDDGQVTTRPAQPIAVPRSNAAAPIQVDGLEGEWTRDDLKFPQLKFVQGSGKNSQLFDAGAVIFMEEELLPPPSKKPGAVNPVIRFIPVNIKKSWAEKLTQEQIADGVMFRTVDTIDEVEELGGTTRYVGSQQPDNLWVRSARCLFLIEQPEIDGNPVDHPAFSLTFGNKNYALGVFYAQGGAFTSSANNIMNAAMTSLLVPVLDENGQPKKTPAGQIQKKPMLWKNFWTLTWVMKQVGSFTPWRPVVKLLKEETSPEIREYCAQSSGSGAVAEAATE